MKKHQDPKQPGQQQRNPAAEARQLFAQGRPDLAETLLQQSLIANPRDLQSMIALGVIAAETDRRDLARRRMADVLRVAPRCVPALCWMSILQFEIGETSEAEICARAAATLEPNNAVMHAIIARCAASQDRYAEAIASFERSLALNPNAPAVLYEYAAALLATSHEREAVEALRKSVLLAPDPRVELKLAYLEHRLGRIDEAEQLCRGVLLKSRESALAHSLMGRILIERQKPEEAEEHWQEASRLDPTPGLFGLEKALSLTSVGRFEDAATELRRSIEAKPRQGAAYQALAFSKRIVADDLPLVRQMEELIEDGSLNDTDQIHLMYSLGKSYDNLGEFEKAIDYFDRAHSHKLAFRGTKRLDRSAFSGLIDSRIEMFSKELFLNSKDLGLDSSLPIMIVGMMRSGTTLAEQMLSCHPQVGGVGEQQYWGENERSMIDFSQHRIHAARLRNCAQEFVQLLSSLAPGFARVIDKNPANLQIVGSLHLALPNARIVHMRRNAIDTALSIWMTPMTTTAPFVDDRDDIVFAYKEYMRLMEHWRQVIPPDRLLDVRYEDLVMEPRINMQRIVEFCNLAWNDACLSPERSDKRIKTPSVWQARQPIYRSSTDRWKNYEPWLGTFEGLRGLA